MEMNRKQSEWNSDIITIDVVRLAKALLRKAWLIIAVALLFGSVAYCWTKAFVAPVYCSSFTLYINSINSSADNNEKITSADITASRSLVTTYSTILESQPLLERAAEAAGLNTFGAVTTSTEEESEFIQVNVIMTDPDETYAFAQGLEEVAPDYIAGIVEGSSMQFITEPQYPVVTNSNVYISNAMKGLVAGAFLVAGVVLLLELLDNRAKSERELEERYAMAVLGTIPNLEEAKKRFAAEQRGR